MKTSTTFLALSSIGASASAHLVPRQTNGTASGIVSSTTCNGKTYQYNELAGYGYVPSDAYDSRGDTIGGIGSSIAIPRNSWKVNKKGVYTGTLYAIPDRGWNTEGTVNYQSRVQKFGITFSPVYDNSASSPVTTNIELQYEDTIFLTDPKGNPTSGLDANPTGPYLTFKGFPQLPSTTFTGDGFGFPGPGGNRVVNDNEGLVVANDGTFWISDEYGPYIYQFGKGGKMLQAIMPPMAYIPMRNNSISFSADSPTYFQTLAGITDDVSPADNPTGRDNNHGFEGLTISTDQKYLYALLQAATNQDGGTSGSKEGYTRMVQYDISVGTPELVGEYVVHLPSYVKASTGKSHIAAQSEIHYLDGNQFLVLARDSDAGRGQASSQSVYRHADIFDISTATNIVGMYDYATAAVAPGGVLAANITAATYCSFLDYNVNSQLNRFYLHNGGAQDNGLLNEKWESLALAPVTPSNGGSDGQFFLFSMS